METESPPPKTFVTRMVIEDGKESVLECHTSRWKGRITIAPDVKVGYRNVTETSAGGTSSKTTLTLNEALMTVEEQGLLFGADTRVELDGDVVVEIRTDGIYLAGKKVAALPAK